MRRCYGDARRRSSLGSGVAKPLKARRRDGARDLVRHDDAVLEPHQRLPTATLLALFVGYAATYFHRADLATLAPQLEHEPARAALRAALPDIASLGMLVYAAGKVLGGMLADRFGGRWLFVMALAGATVAEGAASCCSDPVAFAICRAAGMLVLGCAWPALGHVAASVSPRWRLATVMALLSQSYLLGDATVRAVLAAVLASGGDSVAVLRTSTLGLGVAVVVVAVLVLRGHGTSGAAAKQANGNGGIAARATGWLVGLAAMNAALALVRESLSLWGPKLLVDGSAMATDDAVRASAALPLASCASAWFAGRLADRSKHSLFVVTVWPAIVGAVALGALACAGAIGAAPMVALLALASACLAMPMTLASGVLPLRGDGSDHAAAGRATRLGVVDGAGSAGAVLAGTGLGRVLTTAGAPAAFTVLAGIAAVAAFLAVVVTRLGTTTAGAAATVPGEMR
jgi:MFS transporter, OPA family, glycerol-3-phosphate transporter